MSLEELIGRINDGRRREKSIIQQALEANPRDFADTTLTERSPPLSGYGPEADEIFARRNIRSGTELGQYLSSDDLTGPSSVAEEEAPAGERSSGFDPDAAPFQREEGQSWGRAIGIGAGNIPHSVGERFGELGDLIQDPVGAAKGLVSIGKGAGKALFQGSDGKDPDVELAREAWRGFKGSFTPEQLQEDPTAAIANIASALFPGIKGVQLASKAAGAAKLAKGLGTAAKVVDVASDPAVSTIRGGLKPLKWGAKKSGKFTGKIGAAVLGVTTGRGSGPIEEAFKAGYEGADTRQAFLQAVDDKRISEDTVKKVVERVNQEKAEIGAELGEYRREMRRMPQQLDIKDVKKELFAKVGELGSGKESSLTQYAARVEEPDPKIEIATGSQQPGSEWEMVTEGPGTWKRSVDVPPYLDFDQSMILGDDATTARRGVVEALNQIFERGDTITNWELDEIKKGWQMFKSSNPSAQALVRGASATLRKKLYEDSAGYEAAFKRSDEMFDFVEEINKRLKVDLSENWTQEANAAFRSALDEDKDTAMRGVALLEEKFGTKELPLRAEIAGQSLSRDVPTGLVGRSAVAGVASGLLAIGGAFAHPALLLPILGLPAFFPANVGRWMSRYGAGARMVKETTDTLNRLLEYSKINRIAAEGLTIGQLIERVTGDQVGLGEQPVSEPQQKKSLLGNIGAEVKRGPYMTELREGSRVMPVDPMMEGPRMVPVEPTMSPMVEGPRIMPVEPTMSPKMEKGRFSLPNVKARRHTSRRRR